MSETRANLRASLVADYLQLRDRLATRLGSQDLAGEALHEMWLKLKDGPDLAPVTDANAYLYRAALNTASNLRAAGRRVLGAVEVDAILNLADDAPDPERAAMGKSEVARLRKALRELTPRQRHIFMESFAGEPNHKALADRYGVTVRLVQMELRHAILHCARRTARGNLFAPGALRVSKG